MFPTNIFFIAYLYRPRNCRSDGDRRPTPSYRSLGYRGWVSVVFPVYTQQRIDSRFFFSPSGVVASLLVEVFALVSGLLTVVVPLVTGLVATLLTLNLNIVVHVLGLS